MNLSTLVCFLGAALQVALASGMHSESQGAPRPRLKAKVSAAPRVNVTFPGKGTSFGWDVGVTLALQQNVAAIRNNDVMISGSSSGAVLAAYHSCHGFDDEALRNLTKKITHFNKRLVNEHEKRIARVLLHRPTEYSFSPVDEVLKAIIPDDCVPRFPTLIVAANAEVLHTGKGVSGGVATNRFLRERKSIDSSFNVTAGPIRGGSAHLGKGCTYFVDKTLFESMQAIPYGERQCDLRLMTTAEDLRFAARASGSEPSYFPWVKEGKPEALLTGAGIGAYQGRHYNGGYAMLNIGGQDAKRQWPEMFTLSTGRPDVGPENLFLKRWYTLNAEEILKRERWFNDAEISLPDSVWQSMQHDHSEIFLSRGEIQRGYDRAIELIKSKQWESAPAQAPSLLSLVDLPRGRGLSPLLDGRLTNDSSVWFK